MRVIRAAGTTDVDSPGSKMVVRAAILSEGLRKS